MTDLLADPADRLPSWRWAATPALCLLVIVAGDVLIYGQAPGIGLGLFLCAVAIAVVMLRHPRVEHRLLSIAAAVFVASALPLVEAPSVLGFGTGLVGLGILALVADGRFTRVIDLPIDALRFAVVAPGRLVADLLRGVGAMTLTGLGGRLIRLVLVWLVPAGLALVFAYLFALANPLIEHGLAWLDPERLLLHLDPGRVLWWLFLAALAWPFLRPRLFTLAPVPQVQGPVQPRAESLLFGRAAIVRALLVFNALFAVETLLDLVYLWGGTTLPDGMSYASYAHRGAYPLIATALLAGGFVLVAMRKGGPAERNPLIRQLVYLWIGQNVLLCASSILRLWLYVEVYSLTELRIAAGVWMLLVAVGLVLICLKIQGGRSNWWLVSTNLFALGIALYAFAFVDTSALIADFNVTHSLEVSGEGEPLDLTYMAGLGPTAIPAFDRYIAESRQRDGNITEARTLRQSLASGFLSRERDWRSWSFRDERLDRYLNGAAAEPNERWSGLVNESR